MTKKSKGHRVYGGQGSHWVGCEESHWDCLFRKECPSLFELIMGMEAPFNEIHKKSIYEIRALLDKAYP